MAFSDNYFQKGCRKYFCLSSSIKTSIICSRRAFLFVLRQFGHLYCGELAPYLTSSPSTRSGMIWRLIIGSFNIRSQSTCTIIWQPLHLIIFSPLTICTPIAIRLCYFCVEVTPFTASSAISCVKALCSAVSLGWNLSHTGQKRRFSRILSQLWQSLKSLDHLWWRLVPATCRSQFWHFMQFWQR